MDRVAAVADGDQEQWRPPVGGSITLTDDASEPYTLRPNIATLRILAEVAEKWGNGQALDLLLFGASIVKRDLSERDAGRIQMVLKSVLLSVIGESEDLEEFVLWRTYTWLRDKQITRKQAAQFAADVLGKEISTDTWRKRVDRWAEARHLPKIEIYKRRGHESDSVKSNRRD